MATVSDLVQVAVPDIGDFDDVPVIEILVSVGDSVSAEDPLVTLESDKATMDVPAPASGTVREIHVAIGEHVSQGSPLLALAPSDGDAAQDAAPASAQDAPGPQERAESALAEAVDQEILQPEEAEPAAVPERSATETPRVSGSETAPIYASPAVRRLARERGVSLEGLTGSGRKGRIVAEDVESRAAGGGRRNGSRGADAAGTGTSELGVIPWPTVDFERFGPVERVARSRIQRISAPALHRNWVMIPHVTHTDEADITELEAWRKQLNVEAKGEVKFTMVSFLVAACVATLREFPQFNASLDGEDLVLRRYYNIGFAADTPGGLVVPVIRNADTKGLRDIAHELSALSEKARAGRLTPGDMSGGTFTISSLGGIGGTSFTPIINAPEVAILGVTRAAMKPVWDGSEFRPRLMVPLSLSYDHRVIDGAAAARFVVHLATVLSDLKRALL